MTTEERLANAEQTMARLVSSPQRLAAVRMDPEELSARLDSMMTSQEVQLAEIRQENRQSRRMWMGVARNRQLFDDDEWRDIFGEAEDA